MIDRFGSTITSVVQDGVITYERDGLVITLPDGDGADISALKVFDAMAPAGWVDPNPPAVQSNEQIISQIEELMRQLKGT